MVYAVFKNEEGLNCSQCVFKDICEKCGKSVSGEMLDMLCGISAGFGIGEICSAVIGGICAMGLFFDEEEIKALRLEFILDFNKKFGSLSCAKLCRSRNDCCDIIDFTENWICGKIKKLPA